MLTLLLFSLPMLIGSSLEDELPVTDPQVVERALSDLEKAFKTGKLQDRLDVLQRHASVADGRVVKWIAKGIKDKDQAVQLAALEALRHMQHPDALDALHKTFKRDAKLLKNEVLHESLLKAIGQHGDPSSIKVLSEGSMGGLGREVARARILGLGNIRSAESVEALLAMMKKTGGGGRRGGGGGAYMEDFRLALRVLTGEDRGREPFAWQQWYKDNKKDLEISEAPPKLDKEIERRWNRYWGVEGDEKDKEKDERRRDRERGGDGDGGDEGGEGRRRGGGDDD